MRGDAETRSMSGHIDDTTRQRNKHDGSWAGVPIAESQLPRVIGLAMMMTSEKSDGQIFPRKLQKERASGPAKITVARAQVYIGTFMRGDRCTMGY